MPNDRSDDHATWLNHDYTMKCVRRFAQIEDRARKVLAAACRDSSDPNVLRAFHSHEHISGIIAFLRGSSDGPK
jgi:hypothetical protein